MAALWPDLAPRFLSGRPTLDLSFEPLPANLAVEDVAAGKLDFAINSGPAAAGEHPDLTFTPVAADALAVVMPSGGAPPVLTLAQLRDLFTGYVQDWSVLGLPPQPVVLVAREQGSGARATFDQAILGDKPLARTALLLSDDDAVIAYVASHPGAIGYASNAAVKEGVTAVPVEDLTPSQDGYPLVQSVNLVLPPTPKPAAEALSDWLLAPAGQKVLSTRFRALRP